PLVDGQLDVVATAVALDLNAAHVNHAGGGVGDAMGADVEADLLIADALDVFAWEAFSHESVDDDFLGPQFLPPTQISIALAGQSPKLRGHVALGGKDDGGGEMTHRAGA